MLTPRQRLKLRDEDGNLLCCYTILPLCLGTRKLWYQQQRDERRHLREQLYKKLMRTAWLDANPLHDPSSWQNNSLTDNVQLSQ